MRRKHHIFGVALNILLVICLTAMLSLTAMAASPVELHISSDSEKIVPGDTVEFTVSIGSVPDLGVLEFDLIIPEGLSFVEGSVNIPDGLKEALDSDGEIIAPSKQNNYKWAYSAQSKGYSGEGERVLMSFECVADESFTTSDGIVSIKIVDITDNSVDLNPLDYKISALKLNVVNEEKIKLKKIEIVPSEDQYEALYSDENEASYADSEASGNETINGDEFDERPDKENNKDKGQSNSIKSPHLIAVYVLFAIAVVVMVMIIVKKIKENKKHN